MSFAENMGVVRDLFVIAASGVSIVVLLGIGYALLRLYPRIKRTTKSVEHSSSVIDNIVSQPLNLFGAVVELINRGLGMVDEFRKRERREKDEQIE